MTASRDVLAPNLWKICGDVEKFQAPGQITEFPKVCEIPEGPPIRSNQQVRLESRFRSAYYEDHAVCRAVGFVSTHKYIHQRKTLGGRKKK